MKRFTAAIAILLAAAVLTVSAQAPRPTPAAAVIQQYCATCHNERLKTAGLVLDPTEVSRVSAKPEVWEKVVRKLRSFSMPPVSSPRPDKATYDATATFLETELDRAAAAKPNPGTLPLFHRLTRTEYQNTVRDLLGIAALPKEMDYSVLLPADNISSGFDNIADLLFVSPSIMERYLDAARKVSRLAVGDPEMPLMVNIHKLHPEQLQDARVEELPFGTRGGLAIRSYFPVDGEYEVAVDVAGTARDPSEIEISVDGERMQLIPAGSAGGGRGGRGGRGGGRGLEFRIPVKAGERLVGVTFIETSRAAGEETLRPRMRSRGAGPALASVTISGPHEVKGSGDTPSRRRLFVCRPDSKASANVETACARRILQTLTRRAYRRPSTDTDVDRLMPFYTAGRAEGGFDTGIERALERALVSPQFLFRIESQPANASAGTTYRISDL